MNRILIVDDEQEIIDLLGRYLKLEGFQVESALSGGASIQKMKSELFNIVISDIRLPDIDGRDLIRELKSFNPLCNIIIITGYTSMDNVVGCIEAGAVDYFTKPFRDITVLVDGIKNVSKKVDRWKKSIPLEAR